MTSSSSGPRHSHWSWGIQRNSVESPELLAALREIVAANEDGNGSIPESAYIAIARAEGRELKPEIFWLHDYDTLARVRQATVEELALPDTENVVVDGRRCFVQFE